MLYGLQTVRKGQSQDTCSKVCLLVLERFTAEVREFLEEEGEHTAALLLPCALPGKQVVQLLEWGDHKGCSDTTLLAKVTPCSTPVGWSSTTLSGQALSEDAACAALCAAQLLEALKRLFLNDALCFS